MSKPTKVSLIAAEMARLSAKHPKGLLTADAVVKAAKSPSSAMHKSFEWDDRKAGHQYRLHQARELIRTVTIEVAPSVFMPRFVSLKNDRGKEGGYRESCVVFSNASMRKAYVADALSDLEAWQQRYKTISGVAEVYAHARKTLKA